MPEQTEYNNYYALWIWQVIAVITFFVLLGAALYMLNSFYICDSHNCKSFIDAGKKGATGTKEFNVALLRTLHNDGIWCLPYIGAAISTFFALWFLNAPITIINFAITFFVTFATFYFIISWMGHHYVKVIANYSANFIETNVCFVDDPNAAKEVNNKK